MKFSRVVLLASILAAVLAGMPRAKAQQPAYPTTLVRLIVPYAAGGIADLFARALAERISANWGKQIIVEPKPGANAVIGARFVAQAEPDGYTWLLISPAFTAMPSLMKNPGYDPLRDFASVALVATTVNILVGGTSAPFASVKDFVAYSIARANGATYGSPGFGSTSHLGFELFKQVSGAKAQQIAYKGQPLAIPDLINRDLDVMFLTAALALPQVRAGKLKALAIVADSRLRELPDVPTMAEVGYPSVNIGSWIGIAVPAKTPSAVIARINAEINKALASPELVERLDKLQAQGAKPNTPADFADFVRQDVARWAKVVRDGNIEPQ